MNAAFMILGFFGFIIIFRIWCEYQETEDIKRDRRLHWEKYGKRKPRK